MTVQEIRAEGTTDPAAPLLEVRDLTVEFPGDDGGVPAVRGLSYTVAPGEVLGIVGESGSGKSVSSLAVMGLLPASARVTGSSGSAGQELLGLPDRQLSRIRGKRIAMVFQDPLSALTPVYTVGDQIAEAVRVHRGASKPARRRRGPSSCSTWSASRTPRSGPRRSRTSSPAACGSASMIAMAIANDPDVIIADEPTTALDVTIQAQVLEVLETAREITGAGHRHDHPRPRGGRRDRRPGPGHVRRQAGRERAGRRRSTPTRGCRTRSGCSARCPGWTAPGQPLVPIEGHPPNARPAAAGLPVRAALPGQHLRLRRRSSRRWSRRPAAAARPPATAARRSSRADPRGTASSRRRRSPTRP